MQTVSTNLSSLLVQLSQSATNINVNSQAGASSRGYNINPTNDPACSIDSALSNNVLNFGAIADKMAAFKDILTTAADGIFAMQQQGESIRDLIAQAKEGDLSDELLDKIQTEVNERIAAIQKIKENTQYGEVKPLEKPFAIDIPNWQDLVGINQSGEEQEENPMTEVLASITVDMSFAGDSKNSSFNIGASATINIGLTEDGSLQITVDAAMDFDLSGISENGVQSEGAMDIINQFLELLTGKSNDFGTATNIIDQMFASGSANIAGDGFNISATNDIFLENQSSQALKGQIVQHAAITLDSATALQSPGIAINLL